MLVFGFSGSVQTRGQERGAEGKALEVALVVEALRGGREQKRSLIFVQVGAVAAQRRTTSSLGLSCCISSFSMSAGVWAVFALTMTSSILIMSSGKVRLLRWFHSSTNRALSLFAHSHPSSRGSDSHAERDSGRHVDMEASSNRRQPEEGRRSRIERGGPRVYRG